MGIDTESKIELSVTSIACIIYVALVLGIHIKNPYLFDYYAKLILVINITYLLLVGIYPVERYSENIKYALIPL